MPAFAQSSSVPTIHVHSVPSSTQLREASIFWFGHVSPEDNYIDVRTGYTDSDLVVQTNVFDQQMWFDTTPSAADLANWDGGSLYIQTPGGRRFRFDAQVAQSTARTNYQAAYEYLNNTWSPAAVTFSTTSGWRGESPNNNVSEERGWYVSFVIPFVSLGVTTTDDLRVGIISHDKDMGTEIARHTYWPSGFEETISGTWGNFSFGLPSLANRDVINENTVTIRHGLNGAVVTDAMVGGGAVCGEGTDFWNEWGNLNHNGSTTLNVQNQADIADWPCFSKSYFTFPLDQLPSGKVIKSATLSVYLFGNAGGGEFDPAVPSWVQVLRARDSWEEAAIGWNSAPAPVENIGGTVVQPITTFPGWPGIRYDWNVLKAVSDAYDENIPAHLILYSADGAYHSGKYFTSSDTGDWNALGRPALHIVYGDPVELTTTPTSSVCQSRGDLNCSGVVDLSDLSALLAVFGRANTYADVNNDGSVTLIDLSILLSNFGR